MLHMATESEVVQKIRYQVDSYDEQQEQGSKELSQVVPSFQHVKLCAPDTNCTTIAAYCENSANTPFFSPLFMT